MQFLRSNFAEQLIANIDNDNGNIVIEGASFTPQEIFETDKVAFNTAFKEWWNSIKAGHLKKAEEILKLHENRDRFRSLQQIYNEGNVVPFVGAGLSMPSGYIGWTKCLKGMREEANVTKDVLEGLIETGQYEEAAQALYDAMPHDTFNEHLTNKFDNDRDLEGCVRFLPYCFTKSVITTNFDNVLERCYEDADKEFLEVALGGDKIELPFAPDSDTLVKLHGEASSLESRIITKDEYDQHYAANDGLNLLINDIAKNTLLFLGCSLRADRTVTCLKKLLQDNGARASTKHYTFAAIEIEDDQTKRLARRDELAEANIFPIWYSATDDPDECLTALLIKLAENCESLQ